ncbi:MAG: hypothetical protein ACP5QK_11830, partial [Myxococcota bacterium]
MKKVVFISVLLNMYFLCQQVVLAQYNTMTEEEAREWSIEIRKLPFSKSSFDEVQSQFYEQRRYTYEDEYGFLSYLQVGRTCWFYALMNMFRYKILNDFSKLNTIPTRNLRNFMIAP